MDSALSIFQRSDSLEGIVCIHVVEFCWGGTKQLEECVVSTLKKDFLVGTN